jgi:hypothetical protein
MESKSSRAEEPAISPEVVGTPPRRIRLTGNGITLVVVAAGLFGIAAVYACSVGTEAARQYQIRTALRSASNETVGKIEELRNPRHGLKEYVDYTFVVDGKTYSGEAIVPLENYRSIRLTSSLPIRYLPENPAANHPVDWEWSVILELDPYFVLAFLAGLGCILFIPPQMQFERRLAAGGLATIGVVTNCSVSGKYGSFINLKYDFRTQDGILVQGRGSFRTQQEIGAKILILYLPKKPRQNIPYPVSAWRIAMR